MREWAFHMCQLCLWRIVRTDSDNMPIMWKTFEININIASAALHALGNGQGHQA
jgi:hypothetical protein